MVSGFYMVYVFICVMVEWKRGEEDVDDYIRVVMDYGYKEDGVMNIDVLVG